MYEWRNKLLFAKYFRLSIAYGYFLFTDMTNLSQSVAQLFENQFHSQPIIIRSPGRVNLIGEHTDYNGGFVLPAAVDKAAFVAIGLSENEQCTWIAADLKDSFTVNLSNLHYSDKEWPNYIMGVVEQFQKAGYTVKPFNCVFSGDVPIGAGMSSSAALECAIAFALNHLLQLDLEKIKMVKMAQMAENEFVGVKCGIMDQFASMFGKKDHVIQLDCRSLEYHYFPLQMEGIRIVLFDTAVKHSLASSEYNTRREQCEAGVALLQKHTPSIQTLRDVDKEMLLRHQREFDSIIFNRCMYVVEENERLLAACEDLKRGDMVSFGQRMYGSHYGLRDMYEVSCAELDYLVSFTVTEDAVLGARMMGGGFGGCTINLVKEEAVDELFQRLTKAYKIAMGKDLKMYTGVIEQGTCLLSSV